MFKNMKNGLRLCLDFDPLVALMAALFQRAMNQEERRQSLLAEA